MADNRDTTHYIEAQASKEYSKQYSSSSVSSGSSSIKWSGKKFLRSFDHYSSGFTFVKLLFLLFFAFVMYEAIVNSRVFTFSGLLDKFSNYDGVPVTTAMNWLTNHMYISGDWGVFDFFRKFINMLSQCLSLIVNVVSGFMDILYFLFYIID